MGVDTPKRKEKTATNDEVNRTIACDEEISPESEHLDDFSQLIDVLRGLSPVGFEKVCKELLRESGFENVEVTGEIYTAVAASKNAIV